MAAGRGVCVVTIWNLEQRKLHTVLRHALDGPLVSLYSDNSIYQKLLI